MVVIFFGTLDQVEYGIHHTQKRYFESYFVIWQYPEQWIYSNILGFVAIPMPGGHLLGYLLLINLLTAHLSRFKLTAKKLGINVLHAGLILLVISEFMTDYLAIESQMSVNEGGSSNYTFSITEKEMVLIDHSDPDSDTVYSVPSDQLKKDKSLNINGTSFQINTHEYYENSKLSIAPPNAPSMRIPITAGWGENMNLRVAEKDYDYSDNASNISSAIVTIASGTQPLGTWVLSNIINNQLPTQKFEHEGKEYSIALRFTRYYLPYKIELIDFTHDKYPGTEIPRNFSSKIRVQNESQNDEDREVLIYMNNPLRYEGLTFYQQSFDNDETTSIFQVVKNPSWWMPYLSVSMVGLGLLIQFLYHFTKFIKKSAKS